METKFTPGPWRYQFFTDVRESDHLEILAPDGTAILKAAATEYRMKHNAVLIAAAPELYETLDGIMPEFEAYVMDENDEEIRERNLAWLEHCRTVLAKVCANKEYRSCNRFVSIPRPGTPGKPRSIPMADLYGAVCSNVFTVKDVETFKAWFARYHFGYDIQLFVHEENRYVSFAGYEAYPSAYPRILEADEIHEMNLYEFAKQLCEHLEAREIVNVVAGGHENLRSVSFDQLIVAQDCPDRPYFGSVGSDEDRSVLLAKVLYGA